MARLALAHQGSASDSFSPPPVAYSVLHLAVVVVAIAAAAAPSVVASLPQAPLPSSPPPPSRSPRAPRAPCAAELPVCSGSSRLIRAVTAQPVPAPRPLRAAELCPCNGSCVLISGSSHPPASLLPQLRFHWANKNKICRSHAAGLKWKMLLALNRVPINANPSPGL